MNLKPTLPTLPVWPTILLCAVYLFAGLIGHDPWKFDDATHLGVAYEFAMDSDWLRPRIGHDVWLLTPPLYHWIAALLGKAMGWLMPFHDAARLATAFFGAVMLAGLALAARQLHGRTAALMVPLLMIGALGLLVPIHDAQPMIALLAMQSTLLFALSRLPAAPFRFGALSGAAIGIGMLTSGLTAITLPITALASLLHPDWRGRSAIGVGIAILAGAVIACIWPLLLAWQSPDLIHQWWKIESIHLQPVGLSLADLQDHLELLGWAEWPVLPIALWALWTHRRHMNQPAVFMPLLATLLALIHILVFTEPRPLNHLPLLPPLALLAAAGAEKLRRGAANAFDWFGMMTFTLIGAIAWLGGISMMTGTPERVARNFTKAEPGFFGQLSWVAIVVASIMTITWLWSIFRLPRTPWRSTAHWAGGVTLIWGLLSALWMPWLDYGKTYRPVAESIKSVMQQTDSCFNSRNLGDAQKASLRYFTGLAPSNQASSHCSWLLVQGTARKEITPKGWRKAWEGNRPGDKSERLRLYRRDE